MHIEFLVEEPSTEVFLTSFVPKVFGTSVTFAIHVFQGKPDLLKKLPTRLKGYASWIPDDWKIVVLLDADNDNCRELKSHMDMLAENAGLVTKTSAGLNGRFQVLNRIAVEELEAWFFGDIHAIKAAYPKISLNIINQTGYREPDAIRGGTAEALERVLKRAGYHSGGLAKIAAARDIANHIDPQRNCSPSFRVFVTGLASALER